MSKNGKSKSFYGYSIVSAGFLIQVMGWGILATYGVFFKPLSAEFEWTRALTSGAFSLTFLLMGFWGIIAGILSDRFGPKLIMSVCGLALGLGYLLMSQINTIWQLYLFHGVVVSIGMSGVDILPLSTVAKWFSNKRGLMSGAVKVGAGVGIFGMPLVANWLIFNYDWRNSYLILGSMVLVLTILAAQFLAYDPRKKELVLCSSNGASLGSDAIHTMLHFREAIRLRQLWILCTIYALTFFCVQTIIVHIIQHGVDLGFSMASAVNIVAAIGGSSILGRILMGNAGDRVGSKLVISVCLLMMAVALFWLQIASKMWMLYLFAAVYGFAHGGFSALLSPLAADIFGVGSHGMLFGIAIFSGNIGGAIGPLLVGYIFDVTGSYQLAFLINALFMLVSFTLAHFLRPNGVKGSRPVLV